jgi:hypothetical protein
MLFSIIIYEKDKDIILISKVWAMNAELIHKLIAIVIEVPYNRPVQEKLFNINIDDIIGLIQASILRILRD